MHQLQLFMERSSVSRPKQGFIQDLEVGGGIPKFGVDTEGVL